MGEPQSWYGRLGKGKNMLPLPGIESVNGGFYDSCTESGQHVKIQEIDTLIMSSQ
jgi:hypothetical protein